MLTYELYRLGLAVYVKRLCTQTGRIQYWFMPFMASVGSVTSYLSIKKVRDMRSYEATDDWVVGGLQIADRARRHVANTRIAASSRSINRGYRPVTAWGGLNA